MIRLKAISWQVVMLALVFLQLSVRRALGSARKFGDENGYFHCGANKDPYQPRMFLRVPMMAWLSKQAHRFSSNPEKTLRSATSFASILTILVSMISAWILGGYGAAIAIGLIMGLMPGRLILSHHIWPDIWLGLWLSLLCLVLVFPNLPPSLRVQLIGLVAALAFMTRFDALFLAPLTGFGMMPLVFWDWVFVLSPTLLVFVVLSIHNARRYRIPWPDTTWMFNLMIAAGETGQEKASRTLIAQDILKICKVWKKLSDQDRFTVCITCISRLTTSPIRTFSGMILRLWASVGPDSFVLNRLLPPFGSAYPEISERLNRVLSIALAFAFPVFFSAIVLAMLIADQPVNVIIWPTIAFGVTSLFHNRTRYRQAWLPGAALLLIATISAQDFWTKLLDSGSILKWFICIVLAFALIRFPVWLDKSRES